ncbi:FAD/NAD(P)-binding domain-containing protein [Crepidotus variabilis]|uniref:FAD/NAD(P)-binding domain-containing protein n=1 Tax=Crepidotus variabilis TaxID=179855 RepID=A0A9P6JSK0_9AGAR|nr:FAD/NAD(P)-binding domain-containing protein [Crepidotus variabilis]
MTQNIVIVGGGVAGLTIFKELSPKLVKNPDTNVILIDPRPFHLHMISSLRMIVTEEGNRSVMPHPPSFNSGNKRVIHSKVTSITDNDNGHFVTLANGETVDFSVLVLATGGHWSGPLAFGNDQAEVSEKVSEWRRKFKNSRNVVLIGGGAVGFELAGEIKDFHPNTKVTIVHKQLLPLNNAYTDRWRRYILSRAQKRGIDIVLDDAVDDLTLANGKILTRGNRSIPADLVVPTFGSRPNTEYIKTFDASVLNSAGEVRVQPTLQVTGHPRIFAAGDIIEWKEEKQALKAGNHAKVIITNILSLLNGSGKLKEYKSGFEMIILTDGPNGGTSYFGLLWGLIFGGWFTRLLKSKSLLIDMMKTSYGLDK